MPIKINNKQVAASKPILEYVSQGVSLPPKPSFQIGHAKRLIVPAFQAYEEERVKLVERFSKKDADGKPVEAAAEEGQPAKAVIEDQDGFNQAIAELQSAEIEIAVSPVKLDSLGDDARLPGIVFEVLDWLIVE